MAMYSNILAHRANLHSDRRRPQTIAQRNHKVEAAGQGHRANYWVRSDRRLKGKFGRKRNNHSAGHGPSTVELFAGFLAWKPASGSSSRGNPAAIFAFD
jgi:hypothetical protein